MTIDPAEPSPLPAREISEGGDDHHEVRYRVLSVKAIWWAAGLIMVVGVGMAVWLLLVYGHGGEQARNQLEAIKTAGTIVVGAGGAAALLLAARRQRSAEIALRQKDRDQADVARAHALQERIAAATELDAAERRVTELYTKAVEQLGSDKAPVRLGGLYALERVAQNNPTQRQTIVNVLCAYLRMPYQSPGEPPSGDADAAQVTEHREQVQERDVRLAAQRVLADHLRPGHGHNPATTFWHSIDLDLTGATLITFTLDNCVARTANFGSATFTDYADFASATFTGTANFASATFTATVNFEAATFTGTADFEAATFTDYAYFRAATFTDDAYFISVTFTGTAYFGAATFTGTAYFNSATFTGTADFEAATFTGAAYFRAATFADGVPAEVARFLQPAAEDATNPPGTG